MKKLVSMVLALVLSLGLYAPVLAAEGEKISADIGEISEPTQGTKIETETAPEYAPDSAPETGQTAVSFADVPEDHTFYAAVMDCAAKGITSGYADGTFKPVNPVTKAQFCVMLSRAFYPGEAEKYNTKVYTDQGWFVPYTRALYMAGVLKDTSFVSAFATSATMGQTIDRYDMAQLITNIMTAKGFSATSDQKSAAQAKISDYKSIPAQYQDAVKNVFALGIITGYSDGAFGGDNAMNRGQGCVVIYRMAQYTPAASNPVTPAADVPPAPKPETPAQPEIPAVKTLSNGKPVTEANVLALLNELKAKYPECSNFGRTGYPAGANSVDTRKALWKYPRQKGGQTSTTAGCGGWATLVSDYIFGQTGFPARQVDWNETHPGDIIVALSADKKLVHVLIATSRPYHDPECENTKVHTTQSTGGGENYKVYWAGEQILTYDDGFLEDQIIIFTRYPS